MHERLVGPLGLLVAAGLTLLLASPARAVDGKLEINQECAAVGCFAGDNPGFPVQLASFTSYIVTSTLSPPADTTAILVFSATEVSVDLNGFAVIGSDSGASPGITISFSSNVEVRNGTVRDFGTAGISAPNAGNHLRFSDLRLLSNTGSGILIVGGAGVQIADTLAALNNADGIVAETRSFVTGCTAINNSGDGIRTGALSLIDGNVASANFGDGIEAGNDSTVTRNTASQNHQHGINLTSSSLVHANTASSNNLSGGAFSNIESCASCTTVDNHAP